MEIRVPTQWKALTCPETRSYDNKIAISIQTLAPEHTNLLLSLEGVRPRSANSQTILLTQSWSNLEISSWFYARPKPKAVSGKIAPLQVFTCLNTRDCWGKSLAFRLAKKEGLPTLQRKGVENRGLMPTKEITWWKWTSQEGLKRLLGSTTETIMSRGRRKNQGQSHTIRSTGQLISQQQSWRSSIRETENTKNGTRISTC